MHHSQYVTGLPLEKPMSLLGKPDWITLPQSFFNLRSAVFERISSGLLANVTPALGSQIFPDTSSVSFAPLESKRDNVEVSKFSDDNWLGLEYRAGFTLDEDSDATEGV